MSWFKKLTQRGYEDTWSWRDEEAKWIYRMSAIEKRLDEIEAYIEKRKKQKKGI